MTKQGKTTKVEQTTTKHKKIEMLLEHSKKCVELFSALTNVGGQAGLDALTNLANSIEEVEATLNSVQETQE